MGKLLDGKKLADQLTVMLKNKTTELKREGIFPSITAIIVGENPASQVYVRNKAKRALEIGIKADVIKLPASITQKELEEQIFLLNHDDSVHAILVQMPLPASINSEEIIEAIDYRKDVDGFHPMNLGRLLTDNSIVKPCTPYGIMKMLEAYAVNPDGKNAVVVGRSVIVGKPMAALLTNANATVTIAHSHTKNLRSITKQADILIVAIGSGHFIDDSYVKEGAVVIDVGMNHNQEGRLIGDVDFEAVEPLASLITPVPKGVGPMTIAMLMYQTIELAKRSE